MRRALFSVLAITTLTAAVPLNAGWDEGVAAFKAKNYETAAREFEQLVEQSGDGYQAHYMLGMTYQALQRNQEALQHLRRAFDLQSSSATRLALGRAYFSLQRYADVAQTLNPIDASKLAGAQQVSFLQMRGQARLKSGDQAGALGDFALMAQVQPTDVTSQLAYGVLAVMHGQLDPGVAAIARAAQLAPARSDIQTHYAQALIKKGRLTRDKTAKRESYRMAAEVAERLVSSNPNYANLILEVKAELGAGLYAKAVATGRAAAAKPEAEWLAHYYLGQALSSNGQHQEAEAPLRTAADAASGLENKKLVWRQLGFALEKQRKYPEASRAYEAAGDAASIARARESERITRENLDIEAENRRIEEMEAEAARLEEELRALEAGGPPPR